MIDVRETRIDATAVRSLVWDGDDLIDWVAGGRRYGPDGKVSDPSVTYAYAFDAAATLQDSNYVVLYTKCATKGLVLREGKVVREIDRSFYLANAYEYPIVPFRLGSGREVIAHCPADYCRLDIEDLASGEILTASNERSPADFFHSRLAVSPNGRWLFSAGWHWHPFDAIYVYDIAAALADPIHLDGVGLGIAPDAWADECNACFMPNNQLVVAVNGMETNNADMEVADGLPAEIQTYDLERREKLPSVQTLERFGASMPVGNHHLLALYGHPRLIDLQQGSVVQRWPHIKSGMQPGSLLVGCEPSPPFAFDSIGMRCAVADEAGISVLQFVV
jgi:hypothetical protein